MICEKCNCKDDCDWYASYEGIEDALGVLSHKRLKNIKIK